MAAVGAPEARVCPDCGRRLMIASPQCPDCRRQRASHRRIDGSLLVAALALAGLGGLVALLLF